MDDTPDRSASRVPPPQSAHYDATNFAAFRNARKFFIVRNADKLREAAAARPQNVVILGTGRSGTTMTAGLMIQLGFEFGDRINGRLGDVDMSEVFDRARGSVLGWRILTLRRDFGRLIRARNAKWGRFCFKSPDLPPFFPLLAGVLRSPIYIMPTRNSFETSFGFSHNAKGMWRKSFFLVNLVQMFLTMIAVWTRRPVFLFSYEQAVRHPAVFIDMLADYLMLDLDEPTRQRMIDYVDPSTGYHPVARLRGHIDVLDNTGVAGWVSDILAMDDPVTLRVRTGERILYEGPTAEQRTDTRDLGYHNTGESGFSVTFDPPLTDAELAGLMIEAPETGHLFWQQGWQPIP